MKTKCQSRIVGTATTTTTTVRSWTTTITTTKTPPIFSLGVVLLTVMLCPLCLSQDNCDEDTLQCYNCDSLTYEGCDDPFNKTFIPQITCKSFCVKYSKISPKGSHIVTRTCMDNMDIKLHIPDEVCRSNIKQGGHICFCKEKSNCNAAQSAVFGRLSLHHFSRHSILPSTLHSSMRLLFLLLDSSLSPSLFLLLFILR